MAALIGAPHQYKQPSRKGKKAWRKNVDVSDIQTGLENLRQEIIQGSVRTPFWEVVYLTSKHYLTEELLWKKDPMSSSPSIQRALSKF